MYFTTITFDKICESKGAQGLWLYFDKLIIQDFRYHKCIHRSVSLSLTRNHESNL